MPGGMKMGGAQTPFADQPILGSVSDHLPTIAGFGLPMTVQATILVLAAGIVTWAAISDLRSNIIPNAVHVALFVLWTGWVISGGAAQVWYSLAIGLAIFAVGAFLFHFGQMGGGDVKFLTVLGIWAGPAEIFPLLLVVAVAGGFLTIFWVVNQQFLAPALGRIAETDSKRMVPYGVAIAMGAYFLFARLWIW